MYDTIINKLSYELREVRIKTGLTDAKGHLLPEVAVSEMGKELYAIANPAAAERSRTQNPRYLWTAQLNAPQWTRATTGCAGFAKLPRIRIPHAGGEYNPTLAVVQRDGKAQDLYLVVETKGYDQQSGIAAGRSSRLMRPNGSLRHWQIVGFR